MRLKKKKDGKLPIKPIVYNNNELLLHPKSAHKYQQSHGNERSQWTDTKHLGLSVLSLFQLQSVSS